MKEDLTTAAVSVFVYRHRLARAEARKARAQQRCYELLIELDYYPTAAQLLTERGQDLYPSADLSQAEADQVNRHMARIRATQEEIYSINQTTRLL